MKSRIYYGWYVLAVAGGGGFLSAGSSQLFLGSILSVIIADTGWSHTGVSAAMTLGTVLGGIAAPFGGALVDRKGPRALIAVAGLVLALGYLLLNLSASLVHFYLAYVVTRVAAQGVLGSAAMRTVPVAWFVRLRGRAMGFTAMAVPLGGAFFAISAQWLLRQGWEWRSLFLLLGLLTLALLPITAWAVLRKGPESLGLLPDGDAEPQPRTDSTQNPEKDSLSLHRQAAEAQLQSEYRWSAKEALATRTMKLLILGSMSAITANGAVVFFMVSFLMERGLSNYSAVSAVSLLALSGAFASLVWGFLSERYSERLLAVCSQLLAMLLMFSMLAVDSTTAAVVLGLIMGLVVRGEGALTGIIIANYFGRWSFGTISGVLTTFQLIGLGVGPLLGALIYEGAGSWVVLFACLALFYGVAALFFWSARKPEPPQQGFIKN